MYESSASFFLFHTSGFFCELQWFGKKRADVLFPRLVISSLLCLGALCPELIIHPPLSFDTASQLLQLFLLFPPLLNLDNFAKTPLFKTRFCQWKLIPSPQSLGEFSSLGRNS